MSNSGPLAGKTALVTGAGRNIGRGIAIGLARAGAAVAVNVSKGVEEAREVVGQIVSEGGKAAVVVADVSDPEAVANMFDEIHAALGQIQILVNNAAIRSRAALQDIRPDDWQRVLAVQLGGAFYCSQRAALDMVELGWGRIVNISGRDGFTGIPFRAHVVVAKAGVHGLTKALASELGPHGVIANTIVPGLIDTTRPPDWQPTMPRKDRVKGIPVDRMGSVDDVVETCLFLVTNHGFVNGCAVHVNGGEFQY